MMRLRHSLDGVVGPKPLRVMRRKLPRPENSNP